MGIPYVITALSLTTISGRVIPIAIVDAESISKPTEDVKRDVLKAFSTMKDTPIDVYIRVKYL